MKDVTPIRGAKKDKNAPRKPVIMKDSASSTSIAKIQYGFSEGTIWGLVDGAKSVILDGTPLEATDGTKNFKNVTYDIRLGTNDQTYMKGFPDVSNEVGIGVELKSSAPYVRAINDTQLSAVRVRLRWNGLSSTNSENGDVSGHRIDYAIDLQTDGGAYAEVLNTSISDKVSTGYERTHRIELPRATKGWQIRIRRLTANSSSEFIRDTMYVDAIAEVIDAKFNYPNTAHMGIEFDSEIFRGIPKLEAHVRGMIVRVPTNYDPVARTYIGIWDGLFKEAYTNNPAWIYYDIITAKRYGLGDRISPNMVDKWTVYALGVYCDQLVPDGLGGEEPRFTCNVYLQKTSDAYQVLSSLSGVFRAMAFWNGERIVLDADMPKDPVYTFSRANVIADENGICFNHTGSRFRDRHTVVKVAWDNPANAFQTEYEYVRDEKAISKYGIRVLDLSAFACTSQGQAQRAGLWALQTEQLETRQITFSVGLDGFLPQVSDVVNVADELFAGRANSGRVSAISAGQFVVTLDRDITVNAGDVLIINGSDGKAERRVVKSVAGRKVTMVAAFTKAEKQNIWALETADLKLMRFRIMSIQENGDSSFNITALQHEPKKFPAIDFGADVIPDNITSITPDVIDAPNKVTITTRHRVVQGQTVTTLVIDWSQVKEAVGYDVEWRKDDGNWIKVPRTGNTSVEIEGVYAGRYTAQVRSISAYEVASPSAFSPTTEVKGKVGLPPAIVGLTVTGVLFGFDLNWSFGAGSGDAAFTEIQVATAPNVNVKQLGLYAYNTNKLQINGLMGNLSQSFRARLVDKLGFTSAWSAWVTGTTSASAAPIMDMIQGQINESSLNKALTSKIEKIETNSSSIGGINTELDKAKADIVEANKLIAANKLETTNAVATANAEITKAKADIVAANGNLATAKTDIIEAKRVADLAKTDSAANKITIASLTTTVGNNKTSVDSSITTLTNKDLALTNLYTALKSEYDANKASISQELIALTNKDTSLSSLLTALDTDYKGNKTAIRNELTAVSTKTDSTANSLTSLTTEVGKNKTAISTEATTRSTEDTALSNRITTISGKTDNALARITTAETAISTNAGAITQSKTDITAAYKQAIESIEVGGRNLIKNTTDTWQDLYFRSGYYLQFYTDIQLEPNTPYTFSFEIERVTEGNYGIGFAVGVGPLQGQYHLDTAWSKGNVFTTVNMVGNRFISTFTFTPEMLARGWYFMSWRLRNETVSFDARIRRMQFEKGNKATNWTPAPEDIDAKIESKADISRVDTVVSDANKALAQTETRITGNYKSYSETKANEALTAAKADSKAKADAATAVANAAQTTANQAKADAISKADAAQAAAITAAKIHADAEAKAKADAALAAAKGDATTKANAAESAAKLAAASDAKAKADQALVDAKADAKLKADAAQAAAKTYTDGVVTPLRTVVNSKADIAALNTVKNDAAAALAQSKTDLTAGYKQAVQEIEVGGRNLIKNTTKDFVEYVLRAGTHFAEFSTYVQLEVGQTYTFSIWVEKVGTDNTTIRLDMGLGGAGGGFSRDVYAWASVSIPMGIRFSKTYTIKEADVAAGYTYFAYRLRNELIASHVKVKMVKLEKGNKATDWTPAPEDTEKTIADNKADIEQKLTVVSNAQSSTAQSLTSLTTTVGGNTTKISQESTARSTADTALGNRITATDAIAKNAQSRVGTAETAISTANSAIATLRTDLVASYAVADTRSANQTPAWYQTNHPRQVVREFKTASAVGISGGGYAYLETTVKYGDASGGNVTQEATNNNGVVFIRNGTGTAWQAWVEQENVTGSAAKVEAARKVLDTRINTTDARVTSEKKVAADATSAVAKTVGTLTTTVNGHTASIQTQQTSINGLNAQYTVKLDVGGRVSGFGLASSTTQSDFAVNADKFYIAPPTGSAKGTIPFMVLTSAKTINGVSVPAGTYMQSAFIHNGSIDIAKINKASITNLSALSANIGHFKSAATGARLEIKDSLLSVYDSNNRLRVRMGVW